ncbi:MAG TPA: carboxypeptidase-like regulatory domain-containing protein [Silvibacterium sp.]|nr:carboxypeptidase-like regulatory domain-containing protein [Silvibacterium sp.]
MKQVVPPTSLSRAFVAVFLFAASVSAPLFGQDAAHRGRKYTPPPPTAKITVTITKAANGKPVENAAVVFHPMKNGKDQGGLELKSNEEGKVSIDVIPIGTTVRLQIIAKGFQTFGQDYQITGDSKDIAVKLNPPDKQYSIYEQHDTSKQQGGADSASDRPAQPDQKPSDSSSKPPQSN